MATLDNMPDGGGPALYTAPDGSQHYVQGNQYLGPADAGAGPSDAGAPMVLDLSKPLPMPSGASDAGYTPAPTGPGPSDAGATFNTQPADAPWTGGTPMPADPYAHPALTGPAPAYSTPPKPAQPTGPGILARTTPLMNVPPAPAKPVAAPVKPAARPARPAGPDAYDLAAKDRAQAEQDAAQARANKATALGQEYENQQKTFAAAEDDWQKNVAQPRLQEAQARLKSMDDTINSGKSAQLDPERWWNSRTGGQKVMGAIALALGGFASAFGAENTGAKLIGDAIARDVDSQRFNIQQAAQDKRDKLAGQSTAFGHFQQLFGDERAAHEATLAYLKNQAALKIEQLTSTMSAPEEVAKGKAMSAQIYQEAQDHKLKAAEIYSNLKTQELQRDHTRLQMAMQGMQLQQMQNPNRLPMPEEVVGPGGQKYNVGDKTIAGKLDDSRRLGKGGLEALHTLASATNGFTSSLSPDKQAEAEAALGKLETVWNGLEGVQSVVGEQQRKDIQEMLKNHIWKPSSSIAAALRVLEGNIRSNVSTTWAQRGIKEDPLADVPRLPTDAQRSAMASAGVR